MTRLIACMVVYNDEKFIELSISSLVRTVKDLDVIEILDGAWKHGGDTPQSTDKTKEIVERLQKKYNNIDIEFRQVDYIFENESHKRNYQLQFIQDFYGYEPYWALIIDADEQIAFPNGMTHIYLKDLLGNMKFMALVTSYAVESNRPMFGVRCIPGGYGYHYHTERSMILHSEGCEYSIDYNLANQKDLQENLRNYQVFHLPNFFIVNYWPYREKSRMAQKAEYAKQQQKEDNNQPCKWPQDLLPKIPTPQP